MDGDDDAFALGSFGALEDFGAIGQREDLLLNGGVPVLVKADGGGFERGDDGRAEGLAILRAEALGKL